MLHQQEEKTWHILRDELVFTTVSPLPSTVTETLQASNKYLFFKNNIYKTKCTFTYNTAVLHLDIYPRDTKHMSIQNTDTKMFIATEFVITKTWKQPKQPSKGE